MARQETVTVTDDIDGGKAHETVAFGLDGVTYEIDLHNKKAAALRKSLADFVSAARHIRAESPFAQPITRRSATRKAKRASGDPTAAEIREWAATAGSTVSGRGRIAASVRDQYLTSHAN